MSYLSALSAGSAVKSWVGTSTAAPSFRMVPRVLALSGQGPGLEAALRDPVGSRRADGAPPERIVLEYDEASGLYAPVWLSVRPREARGRWRLQVTPQFDDILGLLVHRGVPLVWLTDRWEWTGRNVMNPVNPRYLVTLMRPVEVTPA